MNVTSILLPTDFSECARHAVPVAAEFARLLGARVVCLHVVEPVAQPVGWTPLAEPLPAAELGERLEESAARDLRGEVNARERALAARDHAPFARDERGARRAGAQFHANVVLLICRRGAHLKAFWVKKLKTDSGVGFETA